VPETVESLRGSFNRSLRVEGKADRTLVLYGQSITFFRAWLTDQGRAAGLSLLTRSNVLAWLDSLRERGLTTSSLDGDHVHNLRSGHRFGGPVRKSSQPLTVERTAWTSPRTDGSPVPPTQSRDRRSAASDEGNDA
jgi:hypothetical protein